MKKIIGLIALATFMFADIHRDNYRDFTNQNEYNNHRNYDNNRNYNRDYENYSYDNNYRTIMRLRDSQARNFLFENQNKVNYFYYKNYCMPVNEDRYTFINRMFANTAYTNLELLEDQNGNQFIKVINENGNIGYMFDNQETCRNIM